MKNILYLAVIVLGFLVLILSCFFINKKFKMITTEELIYSNIFSIIFFIIFAKIFYIIINGNISLFLNFIMLQKYDILNFIFSGYSFIGGYIGILLANKLFSKIISIDYKKIAVMYMPSMIIMYSVLKIGCFIKGCCGSILNIDIQILESIINLIIYIFIILLMNNIKIEKILGKSIFYFFLTRFIISFFREYSNIYSLIVIELICLVFIYYGIKIIYLKGSDIDHEKSDKV